MKRTKRWRRDPIEVIEQERQLIQAKLVHLHYEMERLQFAKGLLDELIEIAEEAK